MTREQGPSHTHFDIHAASLCWIVVLQCCEGTFVTDSVVTECFYRVLRGVEDILGLNTSLTSLVNMWGLECELSHSRHAGELSRPYQMPLASGQSLAIKAHVSSGETGLSNRKWS